LGKANRNESPAARFPASNTLVSEVTVCVVADVLFVQQTVVPGDTVTVEGENEKLTIETVVSPTWHVVVVLGEAEFASPGRPTRRAAAAKAAKQYRAFTFDSTPERQGRICRLAGTSGTVPKVAA
jgi:hypothetical protein